VYELDRSGRIVYTNLAYASITGYGVDDLLGMSVHELMAPGPARDATPALFEQLVAETPSPTPITAENVTRDGQRIHVEIHWNYRRDEEGRVLGFVCALKDVTERVRADEELRHSEGRFRRMFEQSPWGTVAYDPTGRPLYINPVHRSLMGLSEEELALALEHYNIRKDPQLSALGLAPLIERGFAGEPTALPDRRYVPREMVPPMDKDPLWLRGFIYPVVDAEAGVKEVVVTFEDITAAKQAEAQQAALDLRLQQAERVESLSVLAGGIAHDFNNILVTVLGNAELALMDLPPESPVRAFLTDIASGATRAADLVRQLLVYSGNSEVAKEHLDVTSLVEEVSHLVEATISKKATVQYDMERALPTVEADATQLRQIVMNLIINASEALGDQSGTITVRTGARQCDAADLAETYLAEDLPVGLYCFIEVADTGVGMDEGTRERLFEPFFTTKFAGRGLGLAAVLGIVRGHRGAIQVVSEPGEGTTFRVMLPGGHEWPERQEAAEGAGDWQGKGTMLLVDDEAPVRAVAERMLQRMGFEVVTAPNGRKAVELIREDQDRFVGVVLDLAMPEMDGAECLDELRSIRPDLPVLMSSGYSEQNVSKRFTQHRPTLFVQKPFQFAALSKALQTVFA
jgi:PAS domain S-box-containing protein